MIFAAIGSKTRLIRPSISGYKRIFIGDNVYVKEGAWLAADPITDANKCALKIGSGTYIGRYSHIYATGIIEIGKKVLIADKVYISDNLHGYHNVNLPIIDQPVKQLSAVLIGDGAWLGENVCIVGASVGKNSVIGANAVVTKDIPDYCIAIGAPAKIIKRFDFTQQQWRKTNTDGSFIN